MGERLEGIRGRVVAGTADMLVARQAKGVFAPVQIGGVLGLLRAMTLGQGEWGRRVGRELRDRGLDPTIIVPLSYKGDSADEHDWPARVYFRKSMLPASGSFDQLWPPTREEHE